MQKYLLGLLLLSLLTGCLSSSGGLPSKPASEAHPWGAALRAIDPADAADPANDLTAVYLRQVDDRLQIRVDLLDFQNTNDLSMEIRIRDDSSPTTLPLYIRIPSEENPARIELDPLLATVIVEIPRSKIPSRSHVDVSTPEDNVTGLTLDGPLPTQTAPLLLTFYDTFAGRFPAEALRSWDGAHTGPLGSRHGLKHLLDAVTETRVPVVLLDLKAPQNLSALDAMGILPQIQQLEGDGLLILPDRAEETLFGFPPSPFTWGGIPFQGTLESRLTFANTNDPSHIYHPLFSQTTYIPIAAETAATQPTPEGPSLEVRRALLQTALNTDEKDLLVLGGDLSESTWGSPGIASAMFAYFASRPYIKSLSAEDLLEFPTQTGKPELYTFPKDQLFTKLETHYQNLTQPVLDFVANWQGSPLSSCATDLDKDGQPECVLANEEYIAVLDPQGARLTYLFTVMRDNISRYTQLIGPSWQVAVGLSNPSLWDLSAGEAADPGAHPGAFTDADDPFKPYQPVIQENMIVFTALDGSRTKTFNLTPNGIEAEYRTQEPVVTQVTLLVEPETRFTPGWADQYVQEKPPGGIAWGLRNGPMVSMVNDVAALSLPLPEKLSKGQISIHSFKESLSLLSTPEDPDFSYPPGHYLPFPLAVVEVEMQDGYFLRLERLP